MAVNRGVETFLSVFLLCCWQGTELQPIKTSLGRFRGQTPLAWKSQRKRSSLCFLCWNLGSGEMGKALHL